MTIAEAGALLSERDFRDLALNDPDGQWELHRGQLREKPSMSAEHYVLAYELSFGLRSQVDRDEFGVRVDAGHVRRSARQYYIPDVMVIPADIERALLEEPGTLDAYSAPLPLVVEIWSPSTGDYDIDEKLTECQGRGGLEIWRLRPYERTLTAWRWQPDGSYEETVYDGGTVYPAALPGVAVDLDALFALLGAARPGWEKGAGDEDR
jgi:Uma2 family endonuclease